MPWGTRVVLRKVLHDLNTKGRAHQELVRSWGTSALVALAEPCAYLNSSFQSIKMGVVASLTLSWHNPLLRMPP